MKNTQEQVINIILKDKQTILSETLSDVKFYLLKNDKLFFVLGFKGKKAKPIYYYAFQSEEKMNEAFNRYKAIENKKLDDLQKRVQMYDERKNKIQKDSILYSSWGYEQTNINFYKVLERSGSKVILQELAPNKEFSCYDSGKCTPSEILIGEPFEKRLTKFASVNINSFESASLYNGDKLYFSTYA